MIKAIVFLTLLAVSYAADTPLCAKVVCGSPEGTDKCASYKDGTYTIKSCASGKQCDIGGFPAGGGATGTMECVSAGTAPKVTDQIAGAQCTGTDNCASKKCSGNVCGGMASGAKDCVTVASAQQGGDKTKVCGANLYCDSNNVCSAGIAVGKDCTAGTMPCSYPNICNSKGKCIAVGSVQKGDTCTTSNECATNLFCDSGSCADAVAYTKGSYLHPCNADADCSGGCSCGVVNTEGKGICGPIGTYGSKDVLNSQRDHLKDSTTNCPLNNQASTGCTTAFKLPFGSFSYGSCYSSFKMGAADAVGSVIPTISSNSSVQIVLSFVSFLFFLF